MRRLVRGKVALVAVAVLGCVTATACSPDQWVDVATGTYEPLRDSVASAPAPEIQFLFVDRENSTIWLKHASGAVGIWPFTARAREAWPAGCPANLYSTRMEVLVLGPHPLTLPSLTVEGPILVRNCPRDPVVVVLRDGGEIGGGAAACYGADQCIRFEPAAEDLDLPRSMKGYELYSWRVEGGDEWQHTLVTGTNRLKSYSEVATAESEITDQGVAKITVGSIDGLKSVLGLLPEGEFVTWSGTDRLLDAPASAASLPERNVVREVTEVARRTGIKLSVLE